MLMILAERRFQDLDQQRFAWASGDHNPIHVDALLARRTQAGVQVVHGIHLLLWALDTLALAQPELPPISKLRAQFNKFVGLDERAAVILVQQNPAGAQLIVSIDGMARSKFSVEFGPAADDMPGWLNRSLEKFGFSPAPLDLQFEGMSGRSGQVEFRMTREKATEMFPAAARWLGAGRVAALAATTQLVGMIFPGLHSVYRGLAISSYTESDPKNCLGFRVMDADTRFRRVEYEIAGGGLTGTVTSVARKAPVTQATMDSLLGLVGDREFAGSVALIVGGSRGLGELTAKLVARGGGRTMITWQSGKADAEMVARDIRTAGGACETFQFDALKPAAEQLSALSEIPTHVYYFATPVIFRPQARPFVPKRFEEFLKVYVQGFWDLANAFYRHQPKLSLFYPSSVSLDERPEGMTEYTMAKAAGEVLCSDMNVSLAPMHVTRVRLPRLPTDQTASIGDVETADPLEAMVPIIREVQSWPR